MVTMVEYDSGNNEDTFRDDDDDIDIQESGGLRRPRDEESGDESSNKENDNGDHDDTDSFDVGGKIKTAAFCLLDGIFQDPENEDAPHQRVTLPICQLPSILGRTHKSEDSSFVGMGRAKALSRQQCRIEYRTSSSTPYGQLKSKVNGEPELVYVAGEKNEIENESKSNDVVSQRPVPSTGFFAITALGKNRIHVNGQRIEQGQTAYLYSGSTVKISTFSLYFFTPKIPSKETLEIPASDTTTPEVFSGNADFKKRKLNPKTNIGLSTVSSSAPVVAGGGEGKRNQTLQAEIDCLPTDELLDQMTKAIEENVWDRRHQLIGSTLSYRAVMEASKDTVLMQLAAESKGELSRGEIMDWIAESDRFGEWVEQMLSKMEQKSYQASITKALIKANFKRTASTGRYIKWLLPDTSKKGRGSSSLSKNEDKNNLKNEDNSDRSGDEDEDNMVRGDNGDNSGDDESVDDDEDPVQSDSDDILDNGRGDKKRKAKRDDGDNENDSSSGSENDEDDSNENANNSDEEADLSDDSLGASDRVAGSRTAKIEDDMD